MEEDRHWVDVYLFLGEICKSRQFHTESLKLWLVTFGERIKTQIRNGRLTLVCMDIKQRNRPKPSCEWKVKILNNMAVSIPVCIKLQQDEGSWIHFCRNCKSAWNFFHYEGSSFGCVSSENKAKSYARGLVTLVFGWWSCEVLNRTVTVV